MLIHIIGVIPSLSAVLLYVLGAQLFLLPQRIPHKERNNSDKQGVAYLTQGRDFLCYAVYLGRDTYLTSCISTSNSNICHSLWNFIITVIKLAATVWCR